jgi:hypothetical protein
MGLLDGGIARIFSAALSWLYLDGQLHAGTGDPIYDDAGNITGYTGPGDIPIKVQTDKAAEAVKARAGYAIGDVALIILSRNPAGTIIVLNTDNEITDGYGDRYRIEDAEQDAARAHWICRGRPV